MPFTFSHPAAAVPLARLGLPLSALVVGSMAPDFLYFLALSTQPKFGHSVPGIFLFCVPIGFAGLWVFHRVLKRPLLDLLPESWQRRFAPACRPFAFGPLSRSFAIGLALALGAATHIVWDGFTHIEGWAVELSPWLRSSIDIGLPEAMPMYRVAQHVSTIVGGALLAVWTIRWTRQRDPAPIEPVISNRARVAAAVMIPIFALGFGLWNASRVAWLGDPYWLLTQGITQGVVGFVVGLFLATLAMALIWRAHAAKQEA